MLGLRGRLTAALLAISALTLAVAAASLLVPLDRQLRDDALASLAQTARAAQPAFNDLPASALRRGSPGLERAASDLRRRTAAEVVVLDDRGRVLTATNLDPGETFPDVKQALEQRRLIASIATVTQDERELHVAVPLEAAGRRFGFAIRKSLDDLTAAQSVVRRALLVSALVALAIALLTGVVLATRLVRRLTALRDATLKVAELGPAADLHADNTRDEIGDLTRAFATMQSRLREQEQARRTFVSTASHELRTPLAALRLMLHSVSEEISPRPDLVDARDQLGRALGQTERLGRLAAELLDLSRVDARLPLRRELLELSELARSVIAEFEPRTAESGHRIELLAPEACWAVADPGSVAQILRIVVDNALRHSPPGAPIDIEVELTADRPAVRVRDGGAGVPGQEREIIFERFQRGSNVSADGGFGLGLAIGRELARQMEGELLLAADGPGACFVLSLHPAPASEAGPS
ncbi:MAG: HAMP domain-containing sensor histidine kinase [Solirubrobacteraceae bacterium]